MRFASLQVESLLASSRASSGDKPFQLNSSDMDHDVVAPLRSAFAPPYEQFTLVQQRRLSEESRRVDAQETFGKPFRPVDPNSDLMVLRMRAGPEFR